MMEQQHASTRNSFQPAPANLQPLSFDGFHAAPPFDVIELLPPAAADKLRALRQRSADAHAVCVSHSELQEQTALKNDAEQALKRLTDHPSNGGHNLPPTDPRAVVAEKHLAKMTDDLRRLQERTEARATAWQAASAAMAACEAYLRDGKPGNTTLEAVEIEPPKLAKGENGLLDAVSRLRHHCRELRADLHRIESAPFPSSYAKRKMREQIEALAQRGVPDVSVLIEHDRDIAWPTQRLSSQVIGAEQRALAFAEVTDTPALNEAGGTARGHGQRIGQQPGSSTALSFGVALASPSRSGF